MKRRIVYVSVLLAAMMAMPVFSIDQEAVKRVYSQLSEVMSAQDSDTVASLAVRFEEELKVKSDPLTKLRAGIAYHNMSAQLFKAGKTGYAKKSYEVLLGMSKDQSVPEEYAPFVLTYLGSARALMGNEDGNPMNKINFVKQGIKHLDEAVKKYKDVTPLANFIRGNVCVGLPSFFEKEQVAFEDFTYLEKLAEKTPGSVDASLLGDSYFYLGELWKKKKNVDKAMYYWKKSVEANPSGQSASEAKKRLITYSS
jgi:tetratricopeptide (TPR) repeat protein